MANDGIIKDENLDVKGMVAQRQQEQEEPAYNHGDYVPGKDGEVGGILIDHEEVLRKEANDPHLDDIRNKNYESDIFTIFLNGQSDKYNLNTSDKRKVIDFIAGMTDDFFMNEVDNINK